MNRRRLSLDIVIIVASLAFSACSLPPAAVAGMIHTDFSSADAPLLNFPPDFVTGYVILDTDSNFENGYVQAETVSIAIGDLQTIEGVRYSFDEITPGTYYLYAIVDTDGDGFLEMTSGSGDAFGFYGNRQFSTYNDYVPPAANLEVGETGYWSCDFWLTVQMPS